MSKCKTKITADHLIKDYRNLERKIGRQPVVREYGRYCHSITSLQGVFGRPGWRKLLEAVGAKPYNKFSRESAQACYKRLKAELRRIPSKNEYEEKCCSASTLGNLYGGGGWINLLRSVGDYRGPRTLAPSKAVMLSAFFALEKHLGCAPNLTQFLKLSGYSLKDLRYRFGENAWEGFLKNSINRSRQRPSNLLAKHFIEDFLELQQTLGRRPSINEYSRRCHTPKVLDNVFGRSGWKNMISAVGAKALPKHVISASHLVDDYIETYKRLGKKPSFLKFSRMQRHSLNVLDRAFGKPGWSNLTIAAHKKIETNANK